jgi:hypothetical protein
MVLSESTPVIPRMAITDESYPVVSLAYKLERRGWKHCKHHVVHSTVAIGDFDARGGTRLRWYYRLLYFKLAEALPLSGKRVPSQEVQLYYRCLMEGVAAEPGLAHKDYLLLFNEGREGRKKELLPLVDTGEEELSPVADDDEDQPVFAGSDEEPAPKRARGGRGRIGAGRGRGDGGRGRGRGGDGGDPAPLPLPPVPPPVPPPIPPPGVPVVEEEEEDAPVFAGVDHRPAAKPPSSGLVFISAFLGAEVAYRRYPKPGTADIYANFTMRCALPGCVKDCHKVKGITKQGTKAYGPVEPLARLYAWRTHPWVLRPRVPNHRCEEAGEATVRAMVENHGEDLKALLKQLEDMA